MLAALVVASLFSVAEPPKAPPAMIARFRGAFATWVLDYPSVHVRQAFMYPQLERVPGGISQKPMFCILANTKNRMGGYVGWQWYWMADNPDTGEMLWLADAPTQTQCQKWSEETVQLDKHDYTLDFSPDHTKAE